MSFKRVFVDANIILDLFAPERPSSGYSVNVIDWLSEKDLELFTSCDLITTVYYHLAKIDKEKALKSIEVAAEIFSLIPFSNDEIFEATNLMRKNRKFKDLEDTIQYVLARKINCDLILTNDKGFFSPDIEILTAKDLYERFIKE